MSPEVGAFPIDLLVTTDEFVLSVVGQEFKVPDGYERDSFVLPYPTATTPTDFAVVGPEIRWSSVGQSQIVQTHPFAMKSYENEIRFWANSMPAFERNEARPSDISGPHAFVTVSRQHLLSILATIPDDRITFAVPCAQDGKHLFSTGDIAFGTGDQGSSFFVSMCFPERYLGGDKDSRRRLPVNMTDLDRNRARDFVEKVKAEFAWTLKVMRRIGELAARAK